MKTLIIILNYHVTQLVLDCLRSLEPEVARSPGVRVAVCENGSGGDAETILRKAIQDNRWDSWCDLVAVSPNRGFTGGNNVIIRKAMTGPDVPDFFLLLNSDTIVREGAIASLIEFASRNPAAGIAASLLENPDGSIQGSAYRFYTIANELASGLRLASFSRLVRNKLATLPVPEAAREVDWVPGCSMIIRRKVIEDIGPLDEGFYTYFDDIDYCWNARRAGWSVWVVPRSRVLHLEGAATGVTAPRSRKRRPAYWFQARRRFWLKNRGPVFAALADGAFILGNSIWCLRRVVQRKPDIDPPHFLVDFIRNSVFVTGFGLRSVENPALANNHGETR